jgi:membrane dipeptidase
MELDSRQEERARRLHQESIILLAHDHFLPPHDLNELRRGGVTAKVLMTVVDARAWSKDPRDYQRSISEFQGWFSYARGVYQQALAAIESTRQFRLIRSAQDVLDAKQQGQVGILLGAEGGKLIEDRLENMSTLYDMGLRHVLLSWAYDNQITAGELDKEGKGLTEFGRRVVPEMNRLGMIIDITHISRPAMHEVLELSTRPVLNSHSALKSISHRIPAMTEEEIRRLADRGGVFALHFMTHMLTGRFTPQAQLEDLLVQIAAIAKIGGIDCLALGPDYLPYTEEFKRNTEQPNLSFPVGLESPAELLNLTRGLVAQDYSDEAIHKILGGNLLRLFRETLTPSN